MEKSSIWFSHKEYRYDAELKGTQRVFRWSTNSEIWDWNNCVISAVKNNDILRVVVRSGQITYSKYRKREIEIRYMLGIDVTSDLSEPVLEDYPEPPIDNIRGKRYGHLRKRLALELDDKYWIWQWAEMEVPIEKSDVYKVYVLLKKTKEIPPKQSNIFEVQTKDEERIIPVIYQPAIDSWKNYIREIHCKKINNNEIEVSVLFNNESLRKHRILNSFYEGFRSLFYGRTIDIETFKIILNDGIPTDFTFKGIYSGDYDIQDDTTHEEKTYLFDTIPTHKIKYFFANTYHPIIFINTSNHAMAEHDGNHRLWKWEYLAWDEDSPVHYGEKSRKEIDRSFKPKLKFW